MKVRVKYCVPTRSYVSKILIDRAGFKLYGRKFKLYGMGLFKSVFIQYEGIQLGWHMNKVI